MGLRRNHETPRDRYLSPAEILRLNEALDAHPERTSADAIKLMLLTGARRGEVLSAMWDQFDLDAGVWIKPSAHTKQRREHRVPLSAPAIALLRERRHTAVGELVFPGSNPKQPLTDVKRTWLAICRAANLASEVEKRTRDGAVVVGSDGNLLR